MFKGYGTPRPREGSQMKRTWLGTSVPFCVTSMLFMLSFSYSYMQLQNKMTRLKFGCSSSARRENMLYTAQLEIKMLPIRQTKEHACIAKECSGLCYGVLDCHGIQMTFILLSVLLLISFFFLV